MSDLHYSYRSMFKNSLYKMQGIIIKKADLGEADRFLTIYTKEYGKIQTRAKSVRKLESKLKGFLELFTFSDFIIAKSKTIDIITDVNSLDSFPALHASFNLLKNAFYISDLIDKLVPAPERDERLWRLILKTFEELNQNKQSLDFEEQFLEILGYGNLEERSGKKAPDFIKSLI